jgi:hypothetical protein
LQKIGVFAQNKAKLCKNWIITLILEKNANFLRQKLAKIAENCDHNIDPLVPFQITVNDLPVGRDVDETLRLVQAFQV